MANESARYGFSPVSPHAPTQEFVYSGAAISCGDPVSILRSAGYVTVAATTSGSLCGIAAESKAAAASGNILVYSDPNTKFTATTGSSDGTLTQALIGATIDVQGTTSQFQIAITTTEGVVQVLDVVSGESIGTNCKVICRIYRHQFNGDQTA